MAEQRRPQDTRRTLEEKLNDARPRVEEEVKKIISYLNDEVVRSVRANSSKALRVASARLAKLADHLERGNPKPEGR